jgi:hypothetical protein
MGGSSRHVIPVYLDGATQAVADADIDANSGANWNGLTSRVSIDSSTNMTLKIGVPTHVGTVVFVEAVASSVGSYTIFDNGGNAGSETTIATLQETGDSVTVVWDNNRWRIISETDMASATGSAPVDSVNGETGVVVLDTSDVSQAAAGPFYANQLEPTTVGGTAVNLDTADDGMIPKVFNRTGAANSSITLPVDDAYHFQINNLNATGTVTITTASDVSVTVMKHYVGTITDTGSDTFTGVIPTSASSDTQSTTLFNAKTGVAWVSSSDGANVSVVILTFN